MSDSTVTTCYRHPDRVTRLACTTCGKPICVECSRDASVGQKCPDCAAPAPGARVVNARMTTGRPTYQTSPVTFGIMAVTIAVFVVGYLSPEIDNWLFRNLAQINLLISEGEVYRIFTVALLHGSVMHILFNMYALYLFGPRLEQQVGGAAFGSLYVASAGAGGAAAYVFGSDWIETAGGLVPYAAVGASGAIFGLFGAWIFVGWKMRGSPGGRVMFNQLGILLAINLALPLFVSGIEWRAHLGGLLAGLLIAWLWSVFAVGRPNARVIRTVIALAVALAAVAATIAL